MAVAAVDGVFYMLSAVHKVGIDELLWHVKMGVGIVLSVAEVDPKTRFPRFLFPLSFCCILLSSYHLLYLLPSDTTFTPRRSVISLSATYHIIHPVNPGIGQQYRVSAPAR